MSAAKGWKKVQQENPQLVEDLTARVNKLRRNIPKVPPRCWHWSQHILRRKERLAARQRRKQPPPPKPAVVIEDDGAAPPEPPAETLAKTRAKRNLAVARKERQLLQYRVRSRNILAKKLKYGDPDDDSDVEFVKFNASYKQRRRQKGQPFKSPCRQRWSKKYRMRPSPPYPANLCSGSSQSFPATGNGCPHKARKRWRVVEVFPESEEHLHVAPDRQLTCEMSHCIRLPSQSVKPCSIRRSHQCAVDDDFTSVFCFMFFFHVC